MGMDGGGSSGSGAKEPKSKRDPRKAKEIMNLRCCISRFLTRLKKLIKTREKAREEERLAKEAREQEVRLAEEAREKARQEERLEKEAHEQEERLAEEAREKARQDERFAEWTESVRK